MIPMFPNSSTVSFWRDSPKQNLSPVSRPSFAFHEGKRTCNVTCSTWSNGTVKRATERSPRGKKFGAMSHGKQMGSFLQFVFFQFHIRKPQVFHQSYLKTGLPKKNWQFQGFLGSLGYDIYLFSVRFHLMILVMILRTRNLMNQMLVGYRTFMA